MSSPITYEAYRDIPCGYLVCTEDKALVLPAQVRGLDHHSELHLERVWLRKFALISRFGGHY